jgi:hypothetical protein
LPQLLLITTARKSILPDGLVNLFADFVADIFMKHLTFRVGIGARIEGMKPLICIFKNDVISKFYGFIFFRIFSGLRRQPFLRPDFPGLILVSSRGHGL